MKLNEEQITWLNKCTRSVLTDLEGYYESGGTWSLNSETGLVDVDGSFVCSDQGLKDFKGVRFGVVTGGFDCMWNSLTTLEGGPQKVEGDFWCSSTSLSSLEGSPQRVGGNFYCQHNSLTSLKGAPLEVGGDFYCRNNSLTTLEGGPQEVGGGFYCEDNFLTSLKGAPQEVGVEFNCSRNSLTSLEGGPKKVGARFYCRNNSLTSLEGAPQKVGFTFYCEDNPVPHDILNRIYTIMCDKEVPYLIALGIFKKEIDPLLKNIPEETLKGASLLARNLS